MKPAYRIILKTVVSGLVGVGLILLSFYLEPLFSPPSEHPDVVDGWAAGAFMLVGMLVAMFLSGVIAVILTFNDLSSKKQATYVSLGSGLITALLPLLIAILFSFYAFGLFAICFGSILASLLLSVVGGLSVYLLLSFIYRRRIYG
jgi:hypothetical protein